MDTPTFKKLMEDTYQELVRISDTKGKEYTVGQDRLENFKKQGEDIGLHPLQVWATFVNKHYRAIQAFIRNGGQELSEEKIEGRFYDLMLYGMLGLALVYELKEGVLGPIPTPDLIDNLRREIREIDDERRRAQFQADSVSDAKGVRSSEALVSTNFW